MKGAQQDQMYSSHLESGGRDGYILSWGGGGGGGGGMITPLTR